MKPIVKRGAQAEYYLARQQQELALSQVPGKPEARGVHREMARLYGERASNQAVLDTASDATETLVDLTLKHNTSRPIN